MSRLTLFPSGATSFAGSVLSEFSNASRHTEESLNPDDVQEPFAAGSRMAILTDADFRATMALPDGEMLASMEEALTVPLRVPPPSSAINSSPPFGTRQWQSAVRRAYLKVVARVPKFPCINCGAALASHTTERFTKVEPNLDRRFTENKWITAPYFIWFRNEKKDPQPGDPTMKDKLFKVSDDEEPTFERLKPHFRLCRTCNKQISAPEGSGDDDR